MPNHSDLPKQNFIHTAEDLFFSAGGLQHFPLQMWWISELLLCVIATVTKIRSLCVISKLETLPSWIKVTVPGSEGNVLHYGHRPSADFPRIMIRAHPFLNCQHTGSKLKNKKSQQTLALRDNRQPNSSMFLDFSVRVTRWVIANSKKPVWTHLLFLPPLITTVLSFQAFIYSQWHQIFY